MIRRVYFSYHFMADLKLFTTASMPVFCVIAVLWVDGLVHCTAASSLMRALPVAYQHP